MQQQYIYEQNINYNQSILVNKVTVFMDDNGIEVGRSNPHSTLLNPGDDYSEFDSTTRSICDLLWTPEVILDYQQKLQQAINNSLIGN